MKIFERNENNKPVLNILTYSRCYDRDNEAIELVFSLHPIDLLRHSTER